MYTDHKSSRNFVKLMLHKGKIQNIQFHHESRFPHFISFGRHIGLNRKAKIVSKNHSPGWHSSQKIRQIDTVPGGKISNIHSFHGFRVFNACTNSFGWRIGGPTCLKTENQVIFLINVIKSKHHFRRPASKFFVKNYLLSSQRLKVN